MLSRTELEPMSTAAKTGMVYQAWRANVRKDDAAAGAFLFAPTGAEKSRVTEETAAASCAEKSARTSRSKAQFTRSANRFSARLVNSSQSCHSPTASCTDLSCSR